MRNKTYLSVVAVSRNDNHGGDPLIRTQIFINCLAEQCKIYKIQTELIIVDWNPVENEKLLKDVLIAPESEYFELKFVVVPTELHNKFKYSESLPLFQMIGKNVGIRRAQGKFILATNIDIIFSNELMSFIGKKNLKENEVYRLDRFDIRSGLEVNTTLSEALTFAWENVYYKNTRFCDDELKEAIYGNLKDNLAKPNVEYLKKRDYPIVYEDSGNFGIRSPKKVNYMELHTNACGDFTLMSKKGWEEIRGYAEFEAYSFNIDSCGLISAHFNGYREISLLPPMVCFHIEHSLGSGWSLDGETKLFNRLEKSKILNPEWPVLINLFDEILSTKDGRLIFNNEHWGMSKFDLNDRNCTTESMKTINVSSLIAQLDLDLQSYWLLRTDEDQMKKYLNHKFDHENFVNTFYDTFTSKIYVPDTLGRFSEKNSVTRDSIYVGDIYYKLTFLFKGWKNNYPVRFDPFDNLGEGEITKILLINKDAKKVEINYQGGDLHQFVHPMNDIKVDNTNPKNYFNFKSTGKDPFFYINIGNNTKKGIEYELQIISSINNYEKKAVSTQTLIKVDT